MAGPRLLVEPPAFRPLRYGLLDVVDFKTSSDNTHWKNGITYESTCFSGTTVGALTYDECISVTGTGAPPAPSTLTDNLDKVFRGATPFTTYVEFDCSTVGNADAAARTEQALLRSEPWQAERAFWTGTADGQQVVWPHLAANAAQLDALGYVLQTAATVVTGGSSPLDVAEGLGALETALGNCIGGAGIIHVPSVALPTLIAWKLVEAADGGLWTQRGNRVAVGAGYTGTSPSGATPALGSTWMYATGNIIGYRGEVSILTADEAIDRSRNTIKMIARRTYVLGWNCCHAAALIQLGVPA